VWQRIGIVLCASFSRVIAQGRAEEFSDGLQRAFLAADFAATSNAVFGKKVGQVCHALLRSRTRLWESIAPLGRSVDWIGN
jgi:hypothetical protein